MKVAAVLACSACLLIGLGLGYILFHGEGSVKPTSWEQDYDSGSGNEEPIHVRKASQSNPADRSALFDSCKVNQRRIIGTGNRGSASYADQYNHCWADEQTGEFNE